MTKEKLTYVSPETETLVVRFEGVICQSKNPDNFTEYFNNDPYEEL